MPQTYHIFEHDLDDKKDMIARVQHRMDVDAPGLGFSQANIPSFPQPNCTSAPPPTFPTPQSISYYHHPQPTPGAPSGSRKQPSLRAQHEAASRIQRAWRNYLFLCTWRRNANLPQLAVRKRKFDGLTASFVPPSTLSRALAPDVAEIPVSAANVSYASFVRLSSDVLSSLERSSGGKTPVLAYSTDMKPIHAISEDFVRVLRKLDAVLSWGDSAVSEATRKSLAGAVDGEAARLEAWVKVAWFSMNNGKEKAPGMPQPAATQMPSMPQASFMPQMPQAPTQMLQVPSMSQAPTMPQPAFSMPQRSPSRRLGSRTGKIPQPQTQDHPSLRELSDLRSRFAGRLSADFAVPEILEYTLQPACSMSNGLELIARLPTSFLSYRSFTPSSKSYTGPPLAFSAPNKPVHAHSESLVQMLSALDAVESGGDARVRDARKALAGDVEGEAGRVERWWKEAWVLRGGEAEVVKVRT